jgi:hypothetical protein
MRKKEFRLLLTILLVLLGVQVKAEDHLSIQSAEITADAEFTLSIELTNDLTYKAFQMDIVLPEGITPFKTNKGKFVITKDADRMEDTDHSISTNYLADSNTLKLVCTSMGGDEFYGNSGSLFTVKLQAAANIKGGAHQVTLTGIKFTDANNVGHDFADATATFTVPGGSEPEPTVDLYKLTWVVDGQSTVTELESGAAITKPADPEKVGYTFAGWTPAVTTMPAHDETVTAQYSLNTYTVTFLDYNDSILSTQTVHWGEAAQEPVQPSREGYTFAGWDAAFGNVQSDLTIHAQYSINRYAVTIIAGRYTRTDSLTYGTDMEQIVAAVEAVIGRQIVMEDSIYTLVGWTPDLAPVTADITYTAVYTAEARQYKITFVNGIDTLWTDSVEYGQMPVYEGEIPTKESDEQYSYSFAGWTPEITIVTGDATYTAVFEEQPLGPGSGIDRQTADEPVLKFIREDKIYILRGGKLYSVQGQLVQ